MLAVRVNGDIPSNAPKQAEDGRRLGHVERPRQEIEIALDEPRDRRPLSRRVALCAAHHLFVDAQRQLWHIRIVAHVLYVYWKTDATNPGEVWILRVKNDIGVQRFVWCASGDEGQHDVTV